MLKESQCCFICNNEFLLTEISSFQSLFQPSSGDVHPCLMNRQTGNGLDFLSCFLGIPVAVSSTHQRYAS